MPESTDLRRIPMSFDEYIEYDPGEGYRAEWVDGVAIVTPPARIMHQYAGTVLVVLFRQHLPGLVPLMDIGVRTAGSKYRIPDITVIERLEDAVFTEQVPLIVVEVLSRSTRAEDTLRKSVEYLHAGIGQYWIVDRDNRSLTVLANAEHEWTSVLELSDAHPTGSLAVGEYGTVPLDLPAILGP